MGKKKEKITYVDDGRTISDMSGMSGPRLGNRNPNRPRPGAKEVWKTYLNALKMMIGPFLVFVTGMGVVYMILWFLLFLAS